MKWKSRFAAFALLALAEVTVCGQSTDPMLGTWKLNVAKSRTSYKSGTTVIEAVGDAVKATADLVAGDGTAYHWTWTAKYDGKDVPLTGTTPFGPDAVAALTRVDAHTVKIVGKRKGEVVLTQTVVTSTDGRTRTITTNGKDARGQTVSTVAVYDRQ